MPGDLIQQRSSQFYILAVEKELVNHLSAQNGSIKKVRISGTTKQVTENVSLLFNFFVFIYNGTRHLKQWPKSSQESYKEMV